MQTFTQIGDNVKIWSGRIVSHHSTIEDHCFLACNVAVSGHVRIGAHSFLGASATIRDNVVVGQSCVIGAGALIMRSTGDNTVFIAPPTQAEGRRSDTIRFED